MKQKENQTTNEDYDMLAWEMSRLVTYMKDYYSLTDDGIYRIIYGDYETELLEPKNE